ncbi:single-stranded DNA-binding protein [Devriesea agamarum]|uniref:single-stranded DNA-binding protein n=1 Tax=Devriesea agamarum TaxID=472569 RepID=UPI00071D046C|nr:single-stranded DNA-binding protein [Devriesea agamarum]
MKDIRTTVTGNVATDPSPLGQDAHDDAVSFRLAVNPVYRHPESGEWVHRKTEFMTVYARRSLARHVRESLAIGHPVVASGRIGTNEWVSDGGEKMFSLTLHADAIGHDLTFGTATYQRAQRRCDAIKDEPAIDFDTGEVVAERESDLGTASAKSPLVRRDETSKKKSSRSATDESSAPDDLTESVQASRVAAPF